MILGVDGMISLRLATDFSGKDKTMEFMCDLVSKVIEDLGPTNIFSVVMDGDTLSLLYSLLLELDTYYSKPIKGLDKTIRTKLHNVFMSRWIVFHAPVHSAAVAMDRQFCRGTWMWVSRRISGQ